MSATNKKYDQPALHVKQAGKSGGAASIRIDDPNPDIEFVETDPPPNTDPGAGKFEIAVQADRLQINGRSATEKEFDTIVVFQRPEVVDNLSVRRPVEISVSDSRMPNSSKSLVQDRVQL